MRYIIAAFFTFLYVQFFAQKVVFRSYHKGVVNIEYPTTWSLDDSGINGTSLMVLSEKDGLTDLFKENVTLVIEDLNRQQISLDQYIELSKVSLNNISAKNTKISKINTNTFTTDFEMRNGILDLKFHQKVMTIDQKAYVLTYTATQEDYHKYFPIANSVIESFKLESQKRQNTSTLNYENLKHKIKIDKLSNFKEVDVEGNYLMAMSDPSDENYKAYSIKYNNDPSFQLLDQKTYANSMTKDKLLDASKILYNNASINVFERDFPISKGKLSSLHFVYSGIEIASELRLTNAISQFIKNDKLYTLTCQCKSSYFTIFYPKCIELFDSFTIE